MSGKVRSGSLKTKIDDDDDDDEDNDDDNTSLPER